MVDQVATEKIADLSQGLQVWRVSLDDLYEQPKNARTMSPETFERLVANIEERGELESLPYCHVASDGKTYIISGHHRVRASRSAGLKAIPVLLDTTGMQRSQVVSKQLSHNAISGLDNTELLAELYREMQTVEDMLASHLDPKSIGVADAFDSVKIDDLRVDFNGHTIVFAFLPTQLEQFKRLAESLPKDAGMVGALPDEAYSEWISTVHKVGLECDIRSVGSMVTRMCDLVGEWLGEDAPDESWVPIASIFGKGTVPPEAAAVITEAVEKMSKDSEVAKNKWQALEYWAADYLAGN